MAEDDVDVLDSVLSDAAGGYDFEIDCGSHGTITYEMTRVPRTRRQEFISNLPDELVEYMMEQADEQDISPETLESMDSIDEAAPDDAPPASVLGRDEIELMESLILDSLQHDRITSSETEELMNLWPDEMFYAVTFLIVAVSGEGHGVEGFHADIGAEERSERATR